MSSRDEVDVVELLPGIEQAWEVFEVRAALDTLSDDEQEVIRLTHFGGYTHAQTAESLGISVGTVKSRSHRAYQKLAASLAHLLEE